ncbi:transcriptional regulator [Halorubrum salipaludis]|uniref:Transcriptional regulator n=1 Tax=Halorubrum salipaludis TaxID=2032630 RepID=A0A2A2FI35_9EURY|nr:MULTISPECIES: IclR family transcriptional regulator [Halorubrum]PAU85106.1 transcriptional regulator [Halorubrum salipaludis]
MEHTPDRGRVKAVDTTLDVVQFLHRAGSASIEEVAEAVGVGTSTAHRHLTTLHERGYIVREGNEYELSLRFLTHGGRRRETLPANELIHRKVRQLSGDTSERVQFITEEHGERVYMYTHAGPDAVKTDATIGKRGPLHVSAAGKAILANLPTERRERILDGVAANGTAEREALDEELEAVRERGYAFNDEESTSGLRAVGVPVRYESDTVLGAISVSGPANRLTGEYFREELPNLLLGTVNEIELNIEYL